MAFTGFSEDTFRFFKDLKKNNKREWYLNNKERYEQSVVAPARQLATVLEQSSLAKKLQLHASVKNPLFRLHRDVRFSNDKTPFKTHSGMTWTRTGSRKDSGVLYLHVAPEGCFIAAGFYMPDPALLRRFRLSAVEQPAVYKKLRSAMTKGKLDFSRENVLKRMPRGFENYLGEELEDFLKLKGLIVYEDLPLKNMKSATLINTIEAFGKRAHPLLTWGWTHLDAWRREGGDAEYQESLNRTTEHRLR